MNTKRWMVIGLVTAVLVTGTWIVAESDYAEAVDAGATGFEAAGIGATGTRPMGDGPGRFGESGGFGNKPLGRMIRANLGRLITLKAELDITPEQKAAMKHIVEKEKQNFVPIIKQVVESRRALRQAVMSENSDEYLIRKAAEELGQAIGEAAVTGSRVVAEAKMLLTPEQVKLLEAFQAARESSVDKWLSKVAH